MVPVNAWRVVCGNCDTPFLSNEYEETHKARSSWEEDLEALQAAVYTLQCRADVAAANREKARLEVRPRLVQRLWIYTRDRTVGDTLKMPAMRLT